MCYAADQRIAVRPYAHGQRRDVIFGPFQLAVDEVWPTDHQSWLKFVVFRTDRDEFLQDFTEAPEFCTE